jgi:hypothetical protein
MPPAFTTNAQSAKPLEENAITRIAVENGFPSRQPAKTSKIEKRKPRIHRTGRNQQFNAKATPERIGKSYSLANEKFPSESS